MTRASPKGLTWAQNEWAKHPRVKQRRGVAPELAGVVRRRRRAVVCEAPLVGPEFLHSLRLWLAGVRS